MSSGTTTRLYRTTSQRGAEADEPLSSQRPFPPPPGHRKPPAAPSALRENPPPQPRSPRRRRPAPATAFLPQLFGSPFPQRPGTPSPYPRRPQPRAGGPSPPAVTSDRGGSHVRRARPPSPAEPWLPLRRVSAALRRRGVNGALFREGGRVTAGEGSGLGRLGAPSHPPGPEGGSVRGAGCSPPRGAG